MRRGGLALVAIVFLGALARMFSPQTQTSSEPQPSSMPASPANASDQKSATDGRELAEQWYPFVLAEKIRDFFGQEHSPDVIGQEPPCGPLKPNLLEYVKPNLDLRLNHWCVPEPDSRTVRFVIATVPDPIHTHLGLFFDRSIDAIGEGAASQGYTFDRAVMPWHYSEDVNNKETPDQAKVRESFPGLMIFRSEAVTARKPPLFVLVVGETPTAGINKEQFHHSLEIIRDIRQRADSPVPSTAPEFGILGPTFSGSLYSLRIALWEAVAYSRGGTLPVYATVMGTDSIKSFQESGLPTQVRVSIFLEDAAAALGTLQQFVFADLHYQASDSIAVLNEDQTAYGSSYGNPYKKDENKSTFPKDDNKSNFPDAFTLLYPRGISQFRSAYSKEFQSSVSQNGGPNGSQQERRNLRLDLGVTGSDDDSVAPYAKAQTAMSQEGIMLAILSELRLREPKFILLRATDPLDELFLARYLRDNYPQGRLVTPSHDLLFPRDEGGQLDGVLGLSTYPLSPASMNANLAQLCNASVLGPPLIFPASSSAALYNAASMLIFNLGDASSPKLADQSRGAGVPLLSDSPCKMSPDLYLTVMSRNSIRPIKVMEATGPMFFASSGLPLSKQIPQRDTAMPSTWYLFGMVVLVLVILHSRRSWTGGALGRWQTCAQFVPPGRPLGQKAWILWFGGIILIAIFVVLASPNTPVRRQPGYQSSLCLTILQWAVVFFFAVLASADFWRRRKERLLCFLFFIVALLVSGIGIWFAHHSEMEMILWQQRALELTSGVSPATPMLILLLGLYGWFWHSLRGESLVDWRCPQLPEKKELPPRYNRLAGVVGPIRRAIHPFCRSWLIPDIATLVGFLYLALVPFYNPVHVPVRSLEGPFFDKAYSTLLGLALVFLIATLIRLIALWREFRWLLSGLDRVGLKDALRRLSGFEWKIIWNPAWSVEKEGYKLVAQEIQAIERLRENLEPPGDSKSDRYESLWERIKEILALRDELFSIPSSSGKRPNALPSATDLMVPFLKIQRKFAETAGLLCTSFLDESWQHLPVEERARDSGENSAGSSRPEINIGNAVIKLGTAGAGDLPPINPSGLSHISLRLAEQFVACVYANFLVTVLLRVRGMVFSSVILYVCIVFSTISYPFQPAPDLNMLAVVLFLFSGGAIGYVYEEMHRDPTLSRLTSTDPDKVDSAFWFKFAAAGIAPLVALVTVVYPPFGHLLYTLVGPLLQAFR